MARNTPAAMDLGNFNPALIYFVILLYVKII